MGEQQMNLSSIFIGNLILKEDEELTICYAHDHFYQYIGYSKQEVERKFNHKLKKIFRSKDQIQVIGEKKEDEPFAYFYRIKGQIKRKDQTIVYGEINGFVEEDESRNRYIHAFYEDISQRRIEENQFLIEKKLLTVVENLTRDIFWRYHVQTHSIEFFGATTEIFNVEPFMENFPHCLVDREIIFHEDVSVFHEMIKTILSGREEKYEFRMTDNNKDTFWYLCDYMIVCEFEDMNVIGRLENIETRKRLEIESQTDLLTKCLNKMATQERISQVLLETNTTQEHAFIIVDVDDFKQINDSLGHGFGDIVLREIGKKLLEVVRKDDIVGRIGGDEFVVFFKNISNQAAIADKANKILEVFRSEITGKKRQYKVSGSVGIALYPKDGSNYEDLYERADNAMYRAKRSGKDNYCMAVNCIPFNHKGMIRFENQKDLFFENTTNMLVHNQDKHFVFFRFDVDNFQIVNAYFGIEEGDRLLKAIAQKMMRLSETVLSCCGRIGGDIFCGCFEIKSTVECCTHQIEIECQKFIKEYKPEYKLDFSIGLYEVFDYEEPLEAMLSKVSIAAKQCKQNPLKLYSIYHELMEKEILREQLIINSMNSAIKEEQFSVLLQPKISMYNNNVVGAEALVRWEHPTLKTLSPAEFIPIFEKNGFITKLDYWVWDKVFQLLHEKKHTKQKMIPISINVSRMDLFRPDIVQYFMKLLDKYEIEPKYIHIEITESVYIEKSSEISQVILELKNIGLMIEMDDFGSGYSSLNMFSELSIDVLKLDINFLKNIDKDKDKKIIVSFVVSLAKFYHIKVIAEGVESLEQFAFLKEVGCDEGQGFYFSKPLRENDFDLFLEHHHLQINQEGEKE